MKFFAFLLLTCWLTTIRGERCFVVEPISGTISDYSDTVIEYEKCWTIAVPKGFFIQIKVGNIQAKRSCSLVNLKINVAETKEEYKFCSSDENRNPVTALSNVVVTHRSSKHNGYSTPFSFSLDYNI
ncbi:uncharacterized protein CG3556, partial [Caerostris darwini]